MKSKIFAVAFFALTNSAVPAQAGMPKWTSAGHFSHILRKVLALRTPSGPNAAPACRNLLLATDLDDTLLKGMKVNGRQRTVPIRGSESLLPRLAQMAGVATLGLTSRPVLYSDPNYLQVTFKKPACLKQALASQKQILDNEGTYWNKLPAPQQGIEVFVSYGKGGPFGAYLSDVEEAFPSLAGQGYGSHLNFPLEGSQYWYGQVKQNEEEADTLTLKPRQKIVKAHDADPQLNQDWVKVDNIHESGFLVAYWNGILATSELPKGPILRQFLEQMKATHPQDPRFDFDCVVFADDLEKNIISVSDAFLGEHDPRLFLLHMDRDPRFSQVLPITQAESDLYTKHQTSAQVGASLETRRSSAQSGL